MIRNVHERFFPSSPAEAGALLDALSSPADRLWPRDRWPAMRFDRPLGVGARGGHGPIRYTVEEYRPGQRVVFRFLRPALVRGTHALEVLEAQEGVVVRHTVEATPGWCGWLLWPLVFRWLHDALVEDALDNAERALTGRVRSPARWSPWVRLLRRLFPR